MRWFRYERQTWDDVGPWTIIGWFIFLLGVTLIIWLEERGRQFKRALAGRAGDQR